MPIVQVNMLENRTDAQKRELARSVCEAVCRALDTRPESVRVMIHEIGPYDFSVGGVTMAERLGQGARPELSDD